jgi:hypothetical protein
MTDTDRDPQLDAEETEFSNDHPLASPNELAGDAASGLELEFAARDLAEGEAGVAGPSLTSDAQGAASGIDYEEDSLPLEGN